MKEGGASLEMLVEGQTHFQAASEFLDTRQYERAVEILQQAQTTSRQTGDEILVRILDAARRICLACSQCRIEVESHQQAYKEAQQRELELRQQIYAILNLLDERDPFETQEASSSVRRTKTSSSKGGFPESTERLSLWQRIQSLLGRKLITQSPKRAPPVALVKKQVHPLAATLAIPSPVSKQETEIGSLVERDKRRELDQPSLVVYCLGPFRVYQDEQPIVDWPSSRGKAVFKYLVTHRERPVAKEVLMELFWSGAHPDAARNNLNVAIYGLRQALRQDCPSFSHVLFQDDCYLLNPDLQVWVDREAFVEHLATARALDQRGELGAAIREYRAAEMLYQGEFLEEDRYEDWLVPQRQRLQDDYLSLLDRLSRYYFGQEDYAACATVCGKMLVVDACCEEAHRQLMRCYSRQGQSYLALRQYHLCVERLEDELDMFPSQETTNFYEQIRSGGII